MLGSGPLGEFGLGQFALGTQFSLVVIPQPPVTQVPGAAPVFAIPTLPDLATRARNAFRALMPGTDAWLWPNNIYPSAKAIAGAVYELFGFADWVQRQKFAVTADGDNLDAIGNEIGLGRKQPTAATGTAVVTVADSYNAAFGAILQRSDGVQFSVVTPASQVGAGALNLQVQATQTGSTTNTIAGTALTPISGFTDVNSDANATAAVGSAGLGAGTDQEADGPYYTSDLGTYRGRILFKKRNPPQGGAPADYVTWAGQSGVAVTRVYVERLWAGPGTVRVTFMMDNTYANGIPQPSDVAIVANYIAGLAPAGSVVTVVAPTPLPVNVIVNPLLPNTAATQSAVTAELQAAFLRLSSVAGNDNGLGGMNFLAVPTSFALDWLQTAVGNATGVLRGTVTNPVADVVLNASLAQIAVLGVVTFI
jgi:uncharacterized phage protein gp47/JayE